MKMGRRSAGVSAALVAGAAALTLTGSAGTAVGHGSHGEATATGKRPLVISNCRKPRFEPKVVILACGDAGLVARGLEWSRWTNKGATGTGTGVFETCDPDCATGPTVRLPIELSLRKPARCKGGPRLFTRIRYTWPSGAPQGVPSDTVPLGCRVLGGGIP